MAVDNTEHYKSLFEARLAEANHYQAMLFHSWKVIRQQQKGLRRQAKKIKRLQQQIKELADNAKLSRASTDLNETADGKASA